MIDTKPQTWAALITPSKTHTKNIHHGMYSNYRKVKGKDKILKDAKVWGGGGWEGN